MFPAEGGSPKAWGGVLQTEGSPAGPGPRKRGRGVGPEEMVLPVTQLSLPILSIYPLYLLSVTHLSPHLFHLSDYLLSIINLLTYSIMYLSWIISLPTYSII